MFLSVIQGFLPPPLLVVRPLKTLFLCASSLSGVRFFSTLSTTEYYILCKKAFRKKNITLQGFWQCVPRKGLGSAVNVHWDSMYIARSQSDDPIPFSEEHNVALASEYFY